MGMWAAGASDPHGAMSVESAHHAAPAKVTELRGSGIGAPTSRSPSGSEATPADVLHEHEGHLWLRVEVARRQHRFQPWRPFEKSMRAGEQPRRLLLAVHRAELLTDLPVPRGDLAVHVRRLRGACRRAEFRLHHELADPRRIMGLEARGVDDLHKVDQRQLKLPADDN